MRGFAGVLLLLAIILAGGILLMSNMQTKQEYSFKEILPQTKAEITNFEITLKQNAQECNFVSPSNAKACIDAISTNVLNTQQLAGCVRSNSEQIPSTQSYMLRLTCSKGAVIGANSINIDLNRLIIVKKF